MSRYIDIEPYERDGWYLQKRYHNEHCEVVKTTPLISVPTAEAEPIKHGRWLYREEHFPFEKEPRITAGCSECGHSMFSKHDTLNYCPNCGARMDAQIGEDKSHPFAESVMMGMDGGENG